MDTLPPHLEGTWDQRYPSPCEQTDACENITFPLRSVNIDCNVTMLRELGYTTYNKHILANIIFCCKRERMFTLFAWAKLSEVNTLAQLHSLVDEWVDSCLVTLYLIFISLSLRTRNSQRDNFNTVTVT